MSVILFIPIDTQKEAEAILAVLRTVLKDASHLKENITQEDFQVLLERLKQERIKQQQQRASYRVNNIEGPVDTLQEITLFLKILKAHGTLSAGAIDTPEEVALFMDALQQQGVLQASMANARKWDSAIHKDNKNRPFSKL